MFTESSTNFATKQRRLAAFNRQRVAPGLGTTPDLESFLLEQNYVWEEMAFVEAGRRAIAPLMRNIPSRPDHFLTWFKALRESGPGQHDPLFPWLAETASRDEMAWFLTQEVAGEAGFDDLVAVAQVKMPLRAKLEMARNYWDEMGRGDARAVHGLLLDDLADHLSLKPEIEKTVPEALALGNLMMALAFNRRYAFHAVGALGAVELTAPTRATFVVEALERLGVPKKKSHYFSLHAVLDLKHSDAWNMEVLHSLVAEDPRRAAPLAEGALLRLWCGARCFDAYRANFGLGENEAGRPRRWDALPALASA